MASKKIVLLENKDQALEYIKNIDNFREFVPISFTFAVERLLLERGVKFKMEDDYETDSLYINLDKLAIKISKKICENLKINYRGVNLMDLIYFELYHIIHLSMKYLRLLNEIIKKERPKEIIVFETNSFLFLDKEFSSKIIKPIFNGKLIIKKYSISKEKEKKDKNIFRIIGVLQKILSEIKLKFIRDSDKGIFTSGGEIYFKDALDLLLKNKKNKIIEFNDSLSKSFFIKYKYIPFYEFSGKKDIHQEKLKKDIKELIQKINSINFSKEYEIETYLSDILKEWLCNIIEDKFSKISKMINEMIYLIKKNKIDIVLLSQDALMFSKTIARVAELFNIPSIVFLHGLPCGSLVGFMPLESRYIFVYGEKLKEWFIENGAFKSKVKVIGCPRYDSFIKNKCRNKEKTILYVVESTNSYNLVPDRDLTKKQQKQILKKIFKTMKKFPEYKLIIKTKRGWDMNELPKIIAQKEKFENFRIIEKTDNLKLLNDSEIVIINSSTMGIEALILDKPVVSISVKEHDKFNPYKNIKSVEVTYTEKQLEEAIKRIITDKKTREFSKEKELKKYIMNDNFASKRAAKFIQSILNNKNKK